MVLTASRSTHDLRISLKHHHLPSAWGSAISDRSTRTIMQASDRGGLIMVRWQEYRCVKDNSFPSHSMAPEHFTKNPAELHRTASARHIEMGFGDASTGLILRDSHYCKRVAIITGAPLAYLAAGVSSANGRQHAVRLRAKGVVSGRAHPRHGRQGKGTSCLSLPSICNVLQRPQRLQRLPTFVDDATKKV